MTRAPAENGHEPGRPWTAASVLMLAVGFCVIVLSLVSGMRSAAGSSPTRLVATYDFNDGAALPPGAGRVEGAWERGEYGLALPPGASGTVEIDFDAATSAPDQPLSVVLWFYGDGEKRSRIECETAGSGRPVVLGVNSHYDNVPLSLGACQGGGPVTLRLTADVAATASGPALILDQVLVARGGPVATEIRASGTAVTWLLLSAFMLVVGVFVPDARRTLVAVASCMALAVWARGGLPIPWAELSWARLLAVTGVASMLAYVSATHGGRTMARTLAVALIIVVVATAGLDRRAEFLRTALKRPLDPDVTTAISIQQRAQGPFDTAMREPAWVWAIGGLTPVVGDSATAARLFSMLASFGLMIGIGTAAFGMTNSGFVAAGATWLAARHPYLVESASRGLRTEAFALGILVIAYAVFARGWSTTRKAAVLSVGFAATALLQMNTLSMVLPLMVVALLLRRLPVRVAVVATLITAAAIAPHIGHNYRQYGDPLYSINLHARSYRNIEFVQQGQGCPGCPTLDELRTDAYAGAPITMSEYLFALHTPSEVLARTLGGYVDALVGPHPLQRVVLGVEPRWAVGLMGLGLLILAARREWAPLLVLVFGINVLAFLVVLRVDPRMLVQAIPSLLLALAAPLLIAERIVVPGSARYLKRRPASADVDAAPGSWGRRA